MASEPPTSPRTKIAAPVPPGPSDSSSNSFDFIDSSSLSYLVPLATDLDIRAAFDAAPHDTTSDAFLESLARRESLFFDESVDVYLVLRTPRVAPDTLRANLRRLVLNLDATVANAKAGTNAPNLDAQSHPQQASTDTIYSDTVADDAEPVVLDRPSSSSSSPSPSPPPASDSGYVHAVWKLPVPLRRPRIRLQAPSVIFVAAASLKPPDLSLSQSQPDGLKHGYLPSATPSGLNLLESFATDPALNGVQPRLSALRVSRVAPITQQAKDLLRPLRSLSRLQLRVYPALHARIRFSRPNTMPTSPALVAMLDLDFTPFFDCEILVDAISLTLPSARVQDLSKQSAMRLPLSCVAHDHLTFLYRITPDHEDEGANQPGILTNPPTRDLDIAISATAHVEPGFCAPQLRMAWATTVDFTMPLNPGFGSATRPIQRAHRPSQLSIGADSTIATSLVSPSVSQPDHLPSFDPAAAAAATSRTEAQLPELGITMTFTGPPPDHVIRPGDEFVWSVFVVNRAAPDGAASAPAPRKLALVAIPKRRRNESRVNRPPSISRPPPPALPAAAATDGAAPKPKTPAGQDRSVADSVLDDSVVHAMQRSSAVEPAELICLSADARVGPLAPGACHVAELRLLALRPGIVSLEALRVVDLASNEHVDVRELPTVFVDEAV